jgi:rsbT co-antagonist protein RsbR
VIFDITGVPIVDTRVAQVLLYTAVAAQLLGASPALVGIRPEVAQTIIALDIDFSVTAIYPSLQEAVAALLTGSDGHTGAGIAQGEPVRSATDTNHTVMRY